MPQATNKRVYVASSWSNPRQPAVVAALRGVGHEVYDFRNPGIGLPGFSWAQVDPAWRQWSPMTFRNSLQHPAAVRGFELDMRALASADATVLVLPCGRSAHLELGYAVGAGQLTFVLCDQALDMPELMYKMCTRICLDLNEVVAGLQLEAS